MGIKDFFIRKMVESKMKDVPKEEQEKVFKMMEKDPALFQKIALEVQEEIKKGKDQMQASMEVMSKYKDKIQELMK